METQYSKRIDAIIYSPITKGFTKEDWLILAEAARDQRGDVTSTITTRLAHETVYSDGDITFSLADI